jgi:hypothetical protein
MRYRYDVPTYYERTDDLKPDHHLIQREEVIVAHMINQGRRLASAQPTAPLNEPPPLITPGLYREEAYVQAVSILLQAADFDHHNVKEICDDAIRRQQSMKQRAHKAANTSRGLVTEGDVATEIALTVDVFGFPTEIWVDEGDEWMPNVVDSMSFNIESLVDVGNITAKVHGVVVRVIERDGRLFLCKRQEGEEPTGDPA